MVDKMIQTLAAPRFASQWQEYVPYEGQEFTEPSCTVPDQSMTIPEIIAKFTRSGLVPATVRMVDKGGNVADDPESDPLDDWNEVHAAAAAAKAAQKQPEPEATATDSSAPAPAGA